MIKTILTLTMTLSAGLLSLAAHAQMSPVGLWRSIDDESKQPKAEIRINQNAAGGLSGVVERSLQNNPNTDPNCTLCTDDRKDKPKIGMEIIRGGQQSDGKAVWEGGKILDPHRRRQKTRSQGFHWCANFGSHTNLDSGSVNRLALLSTPQGPACLTS
jgi:uncharacterized protein (DUF2147 family)